MGGRRKATRGGTHAGKGAVLGWLVFAGVLGLMWLALGPYAEEEGVSEGQGEGLATGRVERQASVTERPEGATRPDWPERGSGEWRRSPHLFAGNPSRATTSVADRENYLLVKPQFALSYNDTKATANWVSWKLSLSDLGDAPRKAQFDPDGDLPVGFYRVTHRDYSNSGFDRGHLCPHSDRDATVESAHATFVMTNIIPQAPNVNQRSWAMLESYARTLVSEGRYTLVTLSGPWGRGGSGSKGEATAIANGRVTVPEECWKVILVVPVEASDDPIRVTAEARVIAVRVPNRQEVATLEWAGFRVRPSEIESQTGYRFFTALRADVAEVLREKLDTVSIPAPQAPRYGR